MVAVFNYPKWFLPFGENGSSSSISDPFAISTCMKMIIMGCKLRYESVLKRLGPSDVGNVCGSSTMCLGHESRLGPRLAMPRHTRGAYTVGYLACFWRMKKKWRRSALYRSTKRHLASSCFVGICCLHNKSTWFERENLNDNKKVCLLHFFMGRIEAKSSTVA